MTNPPRPPRPVKWLRLNPRRCDHCDRVVSKPQQDNLWAFCSKRCEHLYWKDQP